MLWKAGSTSHLQLVQSASEEGFVLDFILCCLGLEILSIF